MVTITLSCPNCGSEALVRDGHAPNSKQKYRCHGCGRRSRENPTPNAYPEARREEILHAYQETLNVLPICVYYRSNNRLSNEQSH